jgi:hypothetical protein
LSFQYWIIGGIIGKEENYCFVKCSTKIIIKKIRNIYDEATKLSNRSFMPHLQIGEEN